MKLCVQAQTPSFFDVQSSSHREKQKGTKLSPKVKKRAFSESPAQEQVFRSCYYISIRRKKKKHHKLFKSTSSRPSQLLCPENLFSPGTKEKDLYLGVDVWRAPGTRTHGTEAKAQTEP